MKKNTKKALHKRRRRMGQIRRHKGEGEIWTAEKNLDLFFCPDKRCKTNIERDEGREKKREKEIERDRKRE